MRYRVPVEGPHHETASVAMDVFVDDQHRGLTEQPAQHRVRLAGMENLRIAGEHRLDVGGIGQVHHRAHRRHAQGEYLAVATSACGDEPRSMAQHHPGLDRPGQRGPGGSTDDEVGLIVPSL